MSLLSYVEASKRYGISRKVIMRWVRNGQISHQTETRGTRLVTVVEEAEIEERLRIEQGQNMYQEDKSCATSEQQQDKAIALAMTIHQELALRDNQIFELNNKIADLSYELGQARGQLDKLCLLVQEKDNFLSSKEQEVEYLKNEIQVWQREVSAAREEVKRRQWKWPWERSKNGDK